MGDNERLCAMEPPLRLKRSWPQAGLKPGTARSHWKPHGAIQTQSDLNE